MGDGEPLGDIGEEIGELRRLSEGGIGAAHLLQILGPALLGDGDPPAPLGRQRGERRGDQPGEDPGTLAAAQHQQAKRAVHGRIGLLRRGRRSPGARDCR